MGAGTLRASIKTRSPQARVAPAGFNSDDTLPLLLRHGNLARFGRFRLGEPHGQDAVLELGGNLVGVNVSGDGEGAVEIADAVLLAKKIALCSRRTRRPHDQLS